jgi:DNA (cytosine-5)-methyltransferase 1
MVRHQGTTSRRPVAIDLFCGAGGMSLGFEQAGFDVVLGVDADGHHIAAHARNFPQSISLCRSVVDLDAEGLWDVLGGKIDVDLVFGGPPCQGFSHMGLRDAKDPRNTLVDHFCRLVAEIRPRAFVVENVPGMLSGETRCVLDRAVESLERAGYRVSRPRVLDAQHFGVPQKRKRLFVLGVRADVERNAPYPDGACPGQPPRPTVWEGIADLPSVDARDELFERDVATYDREPDNDYARVARGKRADPSDLSYPREWQSDRCSGCLRVRHTAQAMAVYDSTPPGQVVPGHKLPRLDPDGICPTLRAGSDSTHGSYTAPRPIHPFRPRCLTAREAARLHGFPDWFSFYPLKWHAYRQIGNSVCPPVARAVGREIAWVLGCEPTKPTQVVRLSDNFPLPDDRPRTLKRIPHVVHYPPVIARLFENALDGSGRLVRPCFSFADVQAAIQATQSKLPWTRADTFVQEIARSRNARQILAPCLSKGYAIREVSDGDFIGEFVSANEPGSVLDKDVLQVRSRDVANAIPIDPATCVDLENAQTLPALLQEGVVLASLWEGKKVGVDLDPARQGDGHLIVAYRVRNGKGVEGRGCLVVVGPGNLPTRTRVSRFAAEAGADEVVVIARITGRHVAAARFEGCPDAPQEVARRVYEVATPAKGTTRRRPVHDQEEA